MTRFEIDLIHRALKLLQRLVPGEEARSGDLAAHRCPVTRFAKRYLTREPTRSLTTAELWRFYSEIGAAGELEPLTKQAFLRALTGAMEVVFGAKKCHRMPSRKRLGTGSGLWHASVGRGGTCRLPTHRLIG